MLWAQLKFARADYLCFKFPPTKEVTFRHLERWIAATPGSWGWGI
jgi:hypothetical protein